MFSNTHSNPRLVSQCAAGRLLHTLGVAGMQISGLAWDSRGERLALATAALPPIVKKTENVVCPSMLGGHMLLAAVRRAHAWAYIGAGECPAGGTGGRSGTLVYAYHSAGRPGACVAFWDTRSGDRRVKTVRRLLAVTVASLCHALQIEQMATNTYLPFSYCGNALPVSGLMK